MAKSKQKKITKDESIHIRVTESQKSQWEQKAKEAGLSCSAYICTIMDRAASVTSHEENITASMKENHFIHSLLQNPELSDKSKRLIVKEMKKYV